MRELLNRSDDSRNWEVINAGGISYASYRVALLMEELAQYEPDLFIIYSGHNEFLERRTYSTVIETPQVVRGLGALLSRTRTFSAVHRIVHSRTQSDATKLSEEVETILDQSVGLDGYKRDDELQEQVLDHYRFNLNRMIEIAHSCGADVTLATPASNLRDCSPFKSQHRALLDESELARWEALFTKAQQLSAEENFKSALAALDEAAQIDDRYAALHYLRGRALYGLERYDKAEQAFEQARDEDVCPLRALTPMRTIVEEVANKQNVPFVDFCTVVEDHSEHGIPGDNLFLDHVHPTIEGHRLLALTLLDQMQSLGISHPASDWGEESIAEVIETVESRVDPKAHGRALSNLSQVLSWAGKHDESGKLALQAVELIPNDPEAHFLAGCEYARREDLPQARRQFERALELKPGPRVALKVHDNLGLVYSLQGEFPKAERQYQQALEIEPGSARIYNNLGLIAARAKDFQKAAEWFQQATEIEPGFVMAHYNLGLALAELGDQRGAITRMQTVLRMQPDYPGARENLQMLQGSTPGH